MNTARDRRAHAPEAHRAQRAGWLRAAVLGADDGIVSTSSLMLGVIAAHGGRSAILTAGIAGLAAGAMAMAAGEFVSVGAQRDIEWADLARERQELADAPDAELRELTAVYQARGLDPELAREVAVQLTAHDALGAHSRDELGFLPGGDANPLQAAVASALAFAAGALLPLVTLLGVPRGTRALGIVCVAILGLAVLGRLGAGVGGARWVRPTVRVIVGGGLAMAVTAVVGLLLRAAGA